MTVTAWRLFKTKHVATAFTGEGARLYGGRWNSKGTAVVYTAGTASLAALELLVHLSSHQILESYVLCSVTFDEALVEQISPSDLPRGWQSDPAPLELRQVGDAWIATGAAAVLRVPSAIISNEFNYLLNPAHPDFDQVDIGPARPFRFDRRLVK